MVEEAAMSDQAKNWPLYRGTKMLKAVPNTKAEYCLLRGWAVPDNEDPAEAGYTVEYQDGGKPNLDGFAGYVSWSPADVFERAYMPIGSHLDRMKLELAELGERQSKLNAFITHSSQFPKLTMIERNLLIIQRDAMRTYETTLLARVSLERRSADTASEQTGGFVTDQARVGVDSARSPIEG